MNRKIEILFLTSLIITAFSFSSLVFAAPEVVSYKLNGEQENAKLNPSVADSKVSIEINTSAMVKFNTIAICEVSDSVCNRTSAVRYFFQIDSLSSLATKLWDGKTSDKKVDGKTVKGEAVKDGDYKIKVTMVDKDGVENSQKDLSPHIITIDSNFSGGSGGSSSSVSSENSSSQSSSASSDTPSPGVSSFISTHSSPEDLSSSSKSSVRFEASSGRDRLAYSGAPIVFDGEVSVPKDLHGQNVKLVWSFGDGSFAEGKKVSHAYKFAGDYIVVLNASLSDLPAVSRTNVKVVNPSIIISNISGESVEIWNKGAFEINLNGWLILNDRGKFIFPAETIIGPNKKITVPNEYMKLSLAQGGKVSLLNPSQKEISSHPGVLTDVSTTQIYQGASPDLDNDPVVMKIRDFIAKANKVSVENNTVENKISIKTDDKFLTKKEKNLTATMIASDNKIISSSTQTAAVISNSSNYSREGGFLKSFFSLPSSGFNFIREKFYSGN